MPVALDAGAKAGGQCNDELLGVRPRLVALNPSRMNHHEYSDSLATRSTQLTTS